MGEDDAVPERSGLQSMGRSPLVFVTDPSPEGSRVTDALSGAGYLVSDVPLNLLSACVAGQRPNVVVLDVDVEGSLAEVLRIRRMPGTGAIDFIYCGSGGGAIRNTDEALANDGSAFFARPVDLDSLLRKLEALTGGPASRSHENRGSRPPISSIPAPRPSSPSLPAPGLRTPGPPLPMSSPSLAELVDPPRSLATFGTVSQELQSLLAEAEQRADAHSSTSTSVVSEAAPLPTPDEELEAVLPADVLAALDEPIEGDDEDDATDGRPTIETHPGRDAHAKGTTATGGGRQPTTGAGHRPSTGGGSTGTHERRPSSDAPPRTTSGGLATTTPSTLPRPDTKPPSRSPSWAPPAPPVPARSLEQPTREVPRLRPEEEAEAIAVRGPSVQPGPAPTGAVIATPDGARRWFADAIARRAMGALCFETGGVVRRIVLREGDLVTAASGGEDESLVHFLGARGELPKDEVARLADKVPPYGRHAGAALVAHGWLRQDQLWQTLRAHAEWIATTVLRLSGGTAQLEPEPPGRLRSEPSVFGASTGSEIFVDLVRRAIPPEEALERLGGAESRIGDGPNHGLLAECNVPPQEHDLLSRARGGTVADLLARAPDSDIVTVVHALALLGVLDVVPGAAETTGAALRSDSDREIAALDEDALRSRVRARLELVDEGDYFAVLGVARDATSYEIRRAYVDLRRAFEPSRILTPRLADLADDVKKIVVVLEEAYEILRDVARRERYRRAIDARPE